MQERKGGKDEIKTEVSKINFMKLGEIYHACL